MNMKAWILFTVLAITSCHGAPAGIRDISQQDFIAQPPAGALVLDVRTPEEFARGHVPNAVLIPYDQLSSRLSELGADTSEPVVVYCESGKRAGIAGQTLLDAGFKNVLHLDGDMRAWRANHRPTDR